MNSPGAGGVSGEERWRYLGAGVLLAALVLLSYGPAYQAGYIIDDDLYVTANEAVRDADGLGRIWFDLSASPQYYPMVFTTFWVEYRLWGEEPFGYHLGNVLLHALNAVLLWVLLRRLSLPGAWFIAAVFAVHPVHVESVAWVAERKNVLSGAFYLGAALAYLRARPLDDRAEAAAPWVHQGLAFVLFCAAMFSKTAVLTLPAALLLVIWWKRGRLGWRRDVLPLTPMFLVAAVLAWVTIRVETTSGGASGALWDLSWVERLLVAGRALWFYAAKLLWPARLVFTYERWTVDPGVWWQVLYPVAAVGVVVCLWFTRARWGRGPLVAVLYFGGSLLPTLGFVDVFFFRYAYVADHFQYLASIGILALVGSALAIWWNGKSPGRQRLAAGLGAAVLALLGFLTFQQARAYASLESLCEDVLRKNPTSWLANNNLGNIYMERRELERAVERFEVALTSAPDYIETHLNLAIALMNLKRYEQAEVHARRAIEIAPANVLGYLHLGDLLLRADRPVEAIARYRHVLALDPGSWRAELGLANALAASGQTVAAIERYEAVLRSRPENVVARTNLGILLVGTGRPGEGVSQLETAARLEPDDEAIRRNLEIARQRLRALEGESD